MDASRPRRGELLALTAILIVAAILRLGWLTVAEFKLDEAMIASQALDLAELKHFPLHGTRSSIGMYLPPAGIYLYALPLAIWRHPLAAMIFTGAVNVMAVLLCWVLARRAWGARAALYSALLFATSPWAVIFSRKIWEPNLLPALVVLYILFAVLAFVEHRRWALVAHLVLLAIIIQVHYSGLVLAPVSALLMVLGYRRMDKRALLVGLVLAALTALPFALYLWRDRHEVRQVFARLMGQPAILDGQSWRLWWIMATGSDLHSLTGARAFRQFLSLLPNLEPLRWLLQVLFAGGLTYLGYLALRHRKDPAAQAGGIIVLWALAPFLFFLRHATSLPLHYYVVLLPAPSLAMGYVLARVASSPPRIVRWLATAGAVGIATITSAIVLALLSFVSNHATPGGFGVPLQLQLRAVEAARQAGEPIIVLTPGDNPAHHEWAAVLDVLLRTTKHRLVDGTHTAVFPAAPATLLATPGVDVALGAYNASGAALPLQEISPRRGEGPFRVMRLTGEPTLKLRSVFGPRVFANGVEFIGYRLIGHAEPGRAFDWWIAWRVVTRPPRPSADYHIFNHLLDMREKRWAQADSGTARTSDWTPGDIVVQVFRMEIPSKARPGPYWMRVGMYTYPELRNQPLTEAPEVGDVDAILLGPLIAERAIDSDMTGQGSNG